MSDIDHEYTPEIVCPYCGYSHSDSWEVSPDDGEYDCDDCGETFIYTRNVTVEYSTERKEANAGDHRPLPESAVTTTQKGNE